MKRESNEGVRVGYIVTKKLGKAVQRNRIKRRLKEAVKIAFQGAALEGYDYLLIGRAATLTAPFEKIKADLSWCLSHLKRQIEEAGHA